MSGAKPQVGKYHCIPVTRCSLVLAGKGRFQGQGPGLMFDCTVLRTWYLGFIDFSSGGFGLDAKRNDAAYVGGGREIECESADMHLHSQAVFDTVELWTSMAPPQMLSPDGMTRVALDHTVQHCWLRFGSWWYNIEMSFRAASIYQRQAGV